MINSKYHSAYAMCNGNSSFICGIARWKAIKGNAII
jgi:hypothetical protein